MGGCLMADESTPLMDAIDDDGHEHPLEDDQSDGKGLRKQLETQHAEHTSYKEHAEAELAQFREQQLDNAFVFNGLSRIEGMGKAIAQVYEGAPTSEALAQHLEGEYGYVYDGPDHPQAKLIADGQARLDGLGADATSMNPPSSDDVLANAEAAGNYQLPRSRGGSWRSSSEVSLSQFCSPLL
jgi:hypothetical protein